MTDDHFTPAPAPRATVQCYIPRAVADAIDVHTVRVRARTAGIEDSSLEVSTYRLPVNHRGDVLLTTKLATATFMLELIRQASERTEDGSALIAYAAGAKNLVAAIDDALDLATRTAATFIPPPRDHRPT